MRAVVVSATGFNTGIASYLSSEGHSVTEFCGSISSTWNTPSDLTVFDSSVEYTPLAGELRAKGGKVIGNSSWEALLKQDPEYRKSLIKVIGYKQAQGDVSGIPFWINAWFNGQRFIAQSVAFNYSKFMSGDVGVDVASSGYIAYFPSAEAKIFKEVLPQVEKFLRRAGHKGCYSLLALGTGEGVAIQDISAEFDLPFTHAIQENCRLSKSDFLLNVLDESSKPIPTNSPFVCGVLVSVYPYPYAHPLVPKEVIGLNPFNLKHIWLIDAQTRDAINWSCGAYSGCFGYVTARGDTPRESSRRVYRTISNLTIQDIQYRNDIGKGVEEKLDKLKEFKLI